jgi:hypothetical protein
MKYLILCSIILLSGCTLQAEININDSPHNIELYHEGKLIKSWKSKGPVYKMSENAVSFYEKETGVPIQIEKGSKDSFIIEGINGK